MSDIQEQEEQAPEQPTSHTEKLTAARREAQAKREAEGKGWKASKVEMRERILYVKDLLRHSYSTAQIRTLIAERYGIADRMIDIVIQRALDDLVDSWNAIQREQLAAIQMEKLDLTTKLAIENKQYGAAVGAIQAQARMVGIDVPGGSYSKKKNKRST